MNQQPFFFPPVYVQQPIAGGDSPKPSPARVRTAAAVLTHLTDKTADRPVLTEQHGLETIAGQKLTQPELDLQRQACETLEQYLAGELKPNVWEAQELEPPAAPKPIVTLSLGCPVCYEMGANTRGKKNCPMCKGRGRLLILDPATDKGGDDGQGG